MNNTVTIITDIVQTGAIGYLIGTHLATRKAFLALIRMHRNPSYIISPNTDDSGHIHMVLPQKDMSTLHCPHCGAVANLHYRGRECIGCDKCCKDHQ